MKGLMLKDLYILRKKGMLLLAVLAVYGVLSLTMGEASMVSFLSVMMAITLPMTSIAYDERGHFDTYACALPVSRTAIVGARYLMSLLFALGGFAVSLLAGLGISLLRDNSSPLEVVLLTAAASLLVGLFYLSLLLPLLIWLGSEKARIAMIAVFVLPLGLLLLLTNGSSGLVDLVRQEPVQRALLLTVPTVVALLYPLSFLLSLRIYRKKEF